MNKYVIELIDRKQLFYKPIYALRLVELEILKAYLKTHPKTGFIKLSTSLIDTFILFDTKLNYSFHQYVNYQDLNNLKMKNWYFLTLISNSLISQVKTSNLSSKIL